MHSLKVPVVRRWCYVISLEHVQPDLTLIHCDIKTKWSKQVQIELKDGWYFLKLCHQGPIHAMHDPSDKKHEKFLKKFGFKFKATLEDQMEIWIWEK